MKLTVREIKDLLNVPQNAEIAMVDIDSAIAEKILAENNDLNRKISKSQLVDLKRQFTKGDFFISTDCLGFDEKGTLTNGQHRLSAISMLGTDQKFKFGVMFGVSHQMGMDTGKKRSLKDNAIIFEDFDSRLKQPDTIICIDVMKDSCYFIKGNYSMPKFSQKEYAEIINFYAEDLLSCCKAGIFNKIKGIPINVYSAMFLAYLNGVDLSVLQYISEKLTSNVFNGTTDNPIYQLQKKLIEISGGGAEPAIRRQCLTQSCINAVSKKSTTNRLQGNKFFYSDRSCDYFK